MSQQPTLSRPNRLARASSPYLRQHAWNPVDWYPWGAEALERARRENRPILLSVGYSACHWCHVMAHESFENPEIARLMNEHFVCIKVDREERPDVDQVYQLVCQLVSGQGGWPLTAFLTPELEPFYVGTYFPPEPRYGRPGFAQVLQACARAWKEQEAEVRAHARRLAEAARIALHPVLVPAPGMPAEQGRAAAAGSEGAEPGADGGAPGLPGAVGEPSAQHLVAAATRLLTRSDPQAGGFGGAPKFPHPTGLELLLRAAWRFGHQDALAHLKSTLECMAWGGIFDHVGGGFHRYAVDRWWQVPHFEKMLYDNALLVPLYVRVGLWQEPRLWEVARRTLDFLLEQMRLPAGGFAASLDADSPDATGRPAEGFFYRWTPDEVEQAVGDRELARLVCETFAIGALATYRHLHLAADGPPGWTEEAGTVVGRMPPKPPPELDEQRCQQLQEGLRRMKAYREARRARPARDEKVVLAWHALTLSALAAGCQGSPGPEAARYRDAALAGWQFIEERLRDGRWGLLHTAADDPQQAIPAFADDYAATIHAALDLYRLTLDRSFLFRAAELAEQARAKFAEPDGVYCLSSAEHGSPLTRSRDIWDQALPSPNALMAAAHARLAALLDEPSHLEAGRRIVTAFWPVMIQQVSGTAGLWCALDRLDEGTATVRLLAPQLEGLQEDLARLLRLPHPSLELSWQPQEPPPRWVLCTGTVCRAPEPSLEPVLALLGPARR